jgi:homoserine O-succinyltransferase
MGGGDGCRRLRARQQIPARLTRDAYGCFPVLGGFHAVSFLGRRQAARRFWGLFGGLSDYTRTTSQNARFFRNAVVIGGIGGSQGSTFLPENAMPLELEAPPAEDYRLRRRKGNWWGAPIVVGLVNNMPDSALEGTESQFLDLLSAAAGVHAVRLRLAYLPEVERGPDAARRLHKYYWPIDRLLAMPLHALIVTGAEPRAQRLQDERFWDRLIAVLEWASENTVSSIWSCLAAHAAVLHLDGIERRRLTSKCCGVYPHEITPHHMTAGIGPSMPMPHSRWNDLPPDRLAEAGYTFLARSPEVGVGCFARNHRESQFVFIQGHPEYDERALLKEYQRDVGRFVRGEQKRYPTVPAHYFSEETASALYEFEQRASAYPSPDQLESFPFAMAAAGLDHGWREAGVRLYRNWLAYLAAERGETRTRSTMSLAR